MNLCGFTMSFTTAGIHGLYAVMACFMWFVSIAFSLEYMHHYKHKPMFLLREFRIGEYKSTFFAFCNKCRSIGERSTHNLHIITEPV